MPERPFEPLVFDDQNSKLNMKMLFEYSARIGASDILITSNAAPTVRLDGELYPIADVILRPEQAKRLIWSLLNETQQEMLERKRELDFSLSVTGNMRFRANIYYQKGSLAGAFRLIPRHIPTIEELGLPVLAKEMVLRQNGLILVTGPTGSGKTTSMAAMIDLINRTRRCHIVTVEDPIEFVHENKMSIVDQREVYADTLSFANALKYVLRETPDVILVGEMRDLETISAALTAAETGHLVIATLHTNDAIQTIDRIIDVFPPHQHDQIRMQLAFSLIAVFAQQLIPRADGRGRVLSVELLIKNNAVSTHIREGKTHQTRTIMETCKQEGMMTMDARLRELFEGGVISFEEVCRRVSSTSVLNEIKKSVARGTIKPNAPKVFHRFSDSPGESPR